MSWNLLIFAEAPDQTELPLGEQKMVGQALEDAFSGLKWESSSECVFENEGGSFRIDFAFINGKVLNGFTHGGFEHLTAFAALCSKHGWKIADAQVGEEIDLGVPYALYE